MRLLGTGLKLRTITWGAILVACACVMAMLPLFDSLGYEFSFALGLLAALATADVASHVVRRARERRTSDALATPRLAQLWAAGTWRGLALLVVPLAVICANALRVKQCDWTAGFAFFVGIPVMTVPLAALTGVLGRLVTRPGRRLGAWLPHLVILASVAIAVWRFHAEPPVFAYDPYGAYFPGSLYDENIGLGAPFFWARAYQYALALVAFGMAAAFLDPRTLVLSRDAFRSPPLALALLPAAFAALLSAQAAELGFRADADDIAELLGASIETEHFVIHYPEGAGLEPFMDQVARDHEFRFAQLVDTLGVRPTEKIHSFYFATDEDKGRLMGATRVHMAKPWAGQIYLAHDDFPHHPLRHEIAHVFAARFGDPVFGVSLSWLGWPPARFNVGLLEGLAVAADWPGGKAPEMTPHEAASSMRALDMLPPAARLMTPGFVAFSSSQAYTAAGSLARFLLESYGAERMRALYRAAGRPEAFQRIYGHSLEELEGQWHRMLDGIEPNARFLALAQERYRRPGLFSRPCPHAIATAIDDASHLAARGLYSEAAAIAAEVCEDDPGEPRYQLWRARLLGQAGAQAPATELLEALAGGEHTAPLRAEALVELGDLAALAGDLDTAMNAVSRARVLPVDDDTARGLAVRELAYDADNPAGPALRSYLFTPRIPGFSRMSMLLSAQEAARHEPAMGHYLTGRVLVSDRAFAEGARELERAITAGLTDPELVREAHLLLVRASFLSGDLDTAKAAAVRLTEDPRQAIRLVGRDWLERLAWLHSRDE